MTKYITRTFHVHEGKKMVPDYESMKFVELPTVLIDCEELPENFIVDKEYNCKVRMPIETFFNSGERITIHDKKPLSIDEETNYDEVITNNM